jgi:ArsR family transcriptional regulator
VCHIEAVIGRRQAYVSQQLMALREAGLVEARQDGLRVYYRLADPLVADLLDVAFGPVKGDRLDLVHECPCPACEDRRQSRQRP